jgi:hypothetical protein
MRVSVRTLVTYEPSLRNGPQSDLRKHVGHTELTQSCLLFSEAALNEQSLIIGQVSSQKLPALDVRLMSERLRGVFVFCAILLRHWFRPGSRLTACETF